MPGFYLIAIHNDDAFTFVLDRFALDLVKVHFQIVYIRPQPNPIPNLI